MRLGMLPMTVCHAGARRLPLVLGPDPPRVDQHTHTGAQSTYRFGEFLLDRSRRTLLRGADPVVLTPKAFDTLLALIERRDRVVSKDELMQVLWPRVVVEEANLSQNVFFVRKALGDNPQSPRFIATIPGTGYRFVGAVDPATTEPPGRKEAVNGIPPLAQAVASVPQPPPTPSRKVRAWLPTLGLALIIVVVAVSTTRWLSTRPASLPRSATVLVADFENRTGEAIFDDVLRQALVVELGQSPFLRIATDQQVGVALERMRQPTNQRLTGAVALEVCEREGSSVVIAGSIGILARQYVITLEVLSCGTSQRLASVQTTAAGRDDVLTALGKAGSAMRLHLGESLTSVRQFDRPLPAATTASLEALKAYTAGLRAMRFGADESAAIPLFQRAIALDENFAMAYAYHAMVLQNLGEGSRAAALLEKAYALRERVSERERLHIISAYHWLVTGNLDQEMATYQTWMAEYPHDWIPVMMLGDSYLWIFGSPEQSAELLERARSLGPEEWHLERSLAIDYAVFGRVREARSLLEKALRDGADSPALHEGLVEVAYLEGDAALAEEQRRWSARQPAQDTIAYIFEAAAGGDGQYNTMRTIEHEQESALISAGLSEAAALDKANLALAEAETGAVVEARQHVNASMALARARNNLRVAALVLALIGDNEQAEAVIAELEQRFPADVSVERLYVPMARAVISMNRAAPAEALTLLAPAERFELGAQWSFVPLYVRGIVELRAGHPRDAARSFKRIIDNRAVSALSPRWPLAHVGLARALCATGNKTECRSAYLRFFQIWKSADAEIPILEEAKRELAQLH
jgi:DNA-binding winged helix-turn-helix (wHTH) protein/tetratricopeptide (TPR) repeat protein